MMTEISYSGYRFPPEIIQQAIWLYLRFTLSLRDVEDLLAERGILVSYETVRRWVNHFGPKIAADLRKHRPKRSISRSMVAWSTSGAPWIPRVKFSMC
jgi:putative transposase